MGNLEGSGEFVDVLDNSWVQGVVSVGTTQVEAKVGASKSDTREMIIIENISNKTIYYGPSGVTSSTGHRLIKDAWVEIMVGNNLGVYLIADSNGNNVIISELG
jgi:hypothetical protein